jgi:hypothetical protein
LLLQIIRHLRDCVLRVLALHDSKSSWAGQITCSEAPHSAISG